MVAVASKKGYNWIGPDFKTLSHSNGVDILEWLCLN